MFGRHAVDEGAHLLADGLDTVVVPSGPAVGEACGGVVLQRIQPEPTTFVVDAPAPATFGGVDLLLVAMDTAVLIVGTALAAEPDTEIHRAVGLEFKLQDEVLRGSARDLY